MRKKAKIIKEICEELKASSGIPFEYDHFTTAAAVAPPFVLYRRVAAANFSADGVVYNKGEAVDLELYASTPDEMAELMDQVEDLLDENEVFYNQTADTAYIETEDFYETLYEI